MKNISDLTKSELKKEMELLGEKSFRAGQIFKWLHARKCESFDDMTDLSTDLRKRLKEEYDIIRLKEIEKQSSKTDGTKKYLFGLKDGNMIESVFMEYRDWNTACISSQVGCAMGCRFCASTIGGCIRNLTAGEMVSQIYDMEKSTGNKISNVVIMGSGEPLLNYDEFIRFISIITDSDGKGISQRNITVSTCGIVPKIRELAELHLQINLAVSLHASNENKRKELMPVAEKYGLKELMDSVNYYYENTHRRLTFEYALVEGKNDSAQDAKELAGLLRGINGVVNLIPVNPVRESGLKRPDSKACRAFKEKLESMGLNATIRRELGSDIDSACGQLRARRSS